MRFRSEAAVVVRQLSRIFSEDAQARTRRFPPWARPFVFGALLLFNLGLLLIVMPFTLLRFPRLKREQRTLKEIERRAERLWLEESPEAAVAHLRSVLSRLENPQTLSVTIEPYGSVFVAAAFASLIQLLYRYEAAQENWEGALDASEKLIAGFDDDTARPWLLSRAACLMKLGRDSEAKELLFRIRDPSNPNDEADRLLSTLTGRTSRAPSPESTDSGENKPSQQ